MKRPVTAAVVCTLEEAVEVEQETKEWLRLTVGDVLFIIRFSKQSKVAFLLNILLATV